MYGHKDKYLKGSMILFPFSKIIVVGTLWAYDLPSYRSLTGFTVPDMSFLLENEF